MDLEAAQVPALHLGRRNRNRRVTRGVNAETVAGTMDDRIRTIITQWLLLRNYFNEQYPFSFVIIICEYI